MTASDPTPLQNRSASVAVEEHRALLRFTYSAAVVEALKALVPAGQRRWDSSARVWVVATPYLEHVVMLLERLTPPVFVTDRRRVETAEPRVTGPAAGPWHGLSAALPAEYREPVYRALLRALTPDPAPPADPRVTQLVHQLNREFRP